MSTRFTPIRTMRGGVVFDRVQRATYDSLPSFEAATELAEELNDLVTGVKSYREQNWLLMVRDNELAAREEATELSIDAEDLDELSIPGRVAA